MRPNEVPYKVNKIPYKMNATFIYCSYNIFINAVCDVKVDRAVVYFNNLSINIACNVNLVEESKQNVCHTESKKARRKLLDTSYETINNYNAHEIHERVGLFYHVIRVEEMDFSIRVTWGIWTLGVTWTPSCNSACAKNTIPP